MHRTRRVLSGLLAVVALPLMALGVPGTATAHDGHEDAPVEWSNYEKITLTKDVGEPIDLAVLPDGRVLHTARSGDVRLTNPETGVTKIINTIPVYSNSEDGLQTIGISPNFAEDDWVYVYYAPKTMTGSYPATTPTGSAPNTLPAGADESYWDQWKGYNQLSRFKWTGDELDLSSEQVIIKVEVQRGQCCHVGGDFDWDSEGNLYLATGDNTPAGTPGANGFAPNNDAPGMNPGFDARRGAGNSNDLRGKVLRINVQEDGSYTIPEGNLWPEGTEKTRPEVFVTGVRNPFRMDVDGESGTLSWGDYGPDAGTASAERGPLGYVEWNVTSLDKPMNSGWPYCTGDNFNYNEWNFATSTAGAFFDCAAGPQNNSRHNTGIAQLPAATPADLYYGDNITHQPEAWRGLIEFDSQGGQGPMGGPVYHYDPDNTAPGKFPEYWDGKAFFAEFSQDYLAAFTLGGPDGPVTKIEQFLPNSALRTAAQPITDSPMDLEFGPDGSLYVLDYGDGFFRANPDAGLYRIDYSPDNKAPQAKISTDVKSGSSAPLTVQFDGSQSSDTEPGALTYQWDFDGDGTWDSTDVQATHTYDELGLYTARLRVTDSGGRSGIISTEISVGNVAPAVSIQSPLNGSFFYWGEAVPFQITVEDPEDGNTPVCSRVNWTLGLGHDTHAHPETSGTGCTGAWATPANAPEHGETENIYGVIVVSYRDNGANGLPGALGEATLIINPKVLQAEHYDLSQGVEKTADDGASGKFKVTSFDEGDWIGYDPVNFTGIDSVTTVASGEGTLSLRWNSPDAEPFAEIDIPDGSGWQTVNTTFDDLPEGSGKLYVTSSGGVDVDSFTFNGDGVSDKTPPTVTAALNPAQPNGANGWYTSNVTLTVTATDNGTVSSRQYSVNGGTTWSSATNAVTLSTEGTTNVLYRATDNGGNVSEVGALTVKIDKTAPTVEVSGVEAGEYGDSETITPVFSATDATSGVQSVTAKLDGADVASGTAIQLWQLPLGEHELVVTATDNAGKTTTKTVEFTTDTSYDDVRALIDQFLAAGKFNADTAAKLTGRIDRSEEQADKGRIQHAINPLENFISEAGKQNKIADAAVRAVLVRDGEALIAKLREG